MEGGRKEGREGWKESEGGQGRERGEREWEREGRDEGEEKGEGWREGSRYRGKEWELEGGGRVIREGRGGDGTG